MPDPRAFHLLALVNKYNDLGRELEWLTFAPYNDEKRKGLQEERHRLWDRYKQLRDEGVAEALAGLPEPEEQPRA